MSDLVTAVSSFAAAFDRLTWFAIGLALVGLVTLSRYLARTAKN